MKKQNQNLEKVTLTIPANKDYLAIVRLLISGFATKLNFSYEELEELKIAVSEMCLNSIEQVYKLPSQNSSIEITCCLKGKILEIEVQNHGKKFSSKKEPGFGLEFLKEYMKQIELISNSNTGTKISIRKKQH